MRGIPIAFDPPVPGTPIKYLTSFLLACLCAAAPAQTIYRSVDDRGVVTYSTSPVPDAVESSPLRLPPGPTEEQKAVARARHERTQDLAREMAEQRHAHEAERGAEEEEDRVARLQRSGSTLGPSPTRGEVAEEARLRLEGLKESVEHTKESAREELARRREERTPLPREPVHIQPVPGPGADPVRIQPVPSVGPRRGGAAPSGRGGGRRGRGGGG